VAGRGKATHDPSREELVQHLLRVLENQKFEIEAAGVGGHPRPARIRLGLRRARLRPDVVARDGRRSVVGFALDRQLIREPYVPDELDAYAGTCRLLVICVADESADLAIKVLFDKPMPNWRKMRLLRLPGEKFEEVPKAANERRLRDLVRARREAAVHVLPDEH